MRKIKDTRLPNPFNLVPSHSKSSLAHTIVAGKCLRTREHRILVCLALPRQRTSRRQGNGWPVGPTDERLWKNEGLLGGARTTRALPLAGRKPGPSARMLSGLHARREPRRGVDSLSQGQRPGYEGRPPPHYLFTTPSFGPSGQPVESERSLKKSPSQGAAKTCSGTAIARR